MCGVLIASLVMADISTRIDTDAGLALIVLEGEVTAADVVDAAQTLHAQPQWNVHHNVIWDGRGISSLVVGHEEVVEMVDAKIEDSIGKEIMIVVREVDHMIATLCALLMKARGREAEVVATLEEALAALGLDRLPAPLARVA